MRGRLFETFTEFEKEAEYLKHWINKNGELCFDVYGKQQNTSTKSFGSTYYIKVAFDGRFTVSGYTESWSDTKSSWHVLWTNRLDNIDALNEYAAFLIAREMALPNYQYKLKQTRELPPMDLDPKKDLSTVGQPQLLENNASSSFVNMHYCSLDGLNGSEHAGHDHGELLVGLNKANSTPEN